MYPVKVACNASNSAAVDDDGQVWVWGSARHGLLGKKQDLKQTYPKLLELKIWDITEEERKVRDAFTQADDIVYLDVSEIAIG